MDSQNVLLQDKGLCPRNAQLLPGIAGSPLSNELDSCGRGSVLETEVRWQNPSTLGILSFQSEKHKENIYSLLNPCATPQKRLCSTEILSWDALRASCLLRILCLSPETSTHQHRPSALPWGTVRAVP